jgi:hypothetical protein
MDMMAFGDGLKERHLNITGLQMQQGCVWEAGQSHNVGSLAHPNWMRRKNPGHFPLFRPQFPQTRPIPSSWHQKQTSPDRLQRRLSLFSPQLPPLSLLFPHSVIALDASHLDLFDGGVKFFFPKFGTTQGKDSLIAFGERLGTSLGSIWHDIPNFNIIVSGQTVVVEGQEGGTMKEGTVWTDKQVS